MRITTQGRPIGPVNAKLLVNQSSTGLFLVVYCFDFDVAHELPLVHALAKQLLLNYLRVCCVRVGNLSLRDAKVEEEKNALRQQTTTQNFMRIK